MIPRRTWLVAATFALTWCLAPRVLAQKDPDQTQNQSQTQNQPGQANQNPSAKNGAQPNSQEGTAGTAANTANANQQDQKSSNSQQRQSQSTQSHSGAKSGQDANIAPNQNSNSSQQSAAGPGIRQNQFGNVTYWPAGVPGNDFLQWKAYASRIPLSLAPVDEPLRAHLGLPDGEGLVVTAIDPNSSAAEAGIRQNDILIKLGERDAAHSGSFFALSTPESFFNRLKEYGETPVSLTLLRDGVLQTIQVQPKVDVTLHRVAIKAPPREFWIGVTVTAVEPALRAQLKLPPHGRIVTGVGESSPAARAGVQRHDILLDVDGEPLTEPAKLASYVESKGEKPIVLRLVRNGKGPILLTMTPERRKHPASSSTNPPQDGQSFAYTFIQPGGVVSYPTMTPPLLTQPIPGAGNLLTVPNQPYDPMWTGVYQLQGNPAAQPVAPLDAGTAISKRLDALDAELRELRKAVMEYKQSAKALEQLNKTVERLVDPLRNKN